MKNQKDAHNQNTVTKSLRVANMLKNGPVTHKNASTTPLAGRLNLNYNYEVPNIMAKKRFSQRGKSIDQS